jgi:hypothetical protein
MLCNIMILNILFSLLTALDWCCCAEGGVISSFETLYQYTDKICLHRNVRAGLDCITMACCQKKYPLFVLFGHQKKPKAEATDLSRTHSFIFAVILSEFPPFCMVCWYAPIVRFRSYVVTTQVCLRTFPWCSRKRPDHSYIPYDVTNIHDLTDMDVLRQYVYTFLCVFVSRIRYAANYQ